MKSFKQILQESKETYEFRIKIAGELENSCVNTIESALDKYSVISVSKPKRTPIQEHPQDFPPSIINREVNIIDVELEYPTTPDELQILISTCLTCDKSNVVVLDRHSHIEAEREEQVEQAKKPQKYKPLLNSEYPKTPGKPPYGDEYNKKMLKAHKTMKFKSAAGSNIDFQEIFLKDDETGKSSPVGSKK